MDNMVDIFTTLTEEQKDDLGYELHRLHKNYLNEYQRKPNVSIEVVENLRLSGEIFLKVTFELDWVTGHNGTGIIKDIYQYPNKLAYQVAITAERNLN